ncbi:MAG: hypothetical protein U5O39_16885 [Gammaproteobacteria bacterium]|nr:hypothetical protein [Gammaproteobacteria bacterium]
MSGHGGYLVNCVNYAVDQDMFDVMLLAHNFGEDPAFYEQFTRAFDFVANQKGLPDAMRRAKDKDVGIVAMKVLRGAKLNDMRPFEKGGHTYSQAAFKWALRMDTTDAAVISMTSTDLINEYLGASGQRDITQYDYELLEQYARLTDMTYCRQACNDCEGSCPFDVPISDVLRTRMYAVDYQDIDFAKREYAELGAGATPCLNCDGSPCKDACTHGLNIAKLCGPTHADAELRSRPTPPCIFISIWSADLPATCLPARFSTPFRNTNRLWRASSSLPDSTISST